MQDKGNIRNNCLKHRQLLSQKEVSKRSHLIAARLLNSNVWHKAKTIGLYTSVKNEVSTDVLLRQAWQEGKEVFLPCCINHEDNPKLEFFCCHNWSELVPGPFGILEPGRRKGFAYVDKKIPDVIIVPTVGLNKDGYRLGYGKGYYDNLFAQAMWTDTIRVALVYSFQLIDFTPDSFDVPMHAYVTESEVVWIS